MKSSNRTTDYLNSIRQETTTTLIRVDSPTESNFDGILTLILIVLSALTFVAGYAGISLFTEKQSNLLNAEIAIFLLIIVPIITQLLLLACKALFRKNNVGNEITKIIAKLITKISFIKVTANQKQEFLNSSLKHAKIFVSVFGLLLLLGGLARFYMELRFTEYLLYWRSTFKDPTSLDGVVKFLAQPVKLIFGNDFFASSFYSECRLAKPLDLTPAKGCSKVGSFVIYGSLIWVILPRIIENAFQFIISKLSPKQNTNKKKANTSSAKSKAPQKPKIILKTYPVDSSRIKLTWNGDTLKLHSINETSNFKNLTKKIRSEITQKIKDLLQYDKDLIIFAVSGYIPPSKEVKELITELISNLEASSTIAFNLAINTSVKNKANFKAWEEFSKSTMVDNSNFNYTLDK